MMSRSFIINLVLFQIGWFACVLGGSYDQVLTGCLIVFAIIAYHLYRAVDTSTELRLISIALLIGMIYESIVTYLGLAIYTNGQLSELLAPVWLILMWPLFATTLNISMRWLKSMPYWSTALFGAIFAPLAYFAGERLGAVVYVDFAIAMTVIAVAWSVLLPLLVIASTKLDGYSVVKPKQDTREQPQHV